MLFLTEAQIQEVLTYRELIPAIRQALIDFSARRVTQPVRTVLPVNQFSGWFAVMPAVCGTVMGAKMVTFYPKNVDLHKHTHLATIQLFRADTGEPLAIMDGRLITEMRTAAVSAVAINHLAAPNARSLAIFGSGVQARSHFKALSHIRSFTDVRVWSRSSENAQRFAAEIGARATTAEDAAKDADVVLTLTSSAQPVLWGKWLKPDAVVCAIGAVTPDRRELDDDCMRGSIIVESREAALREPGDIIQTNAEISAEIGELLNGAPFQRKAGPVIFKSVGIAVEDIAAAKLVYDKL
jgi:thiomorpholine-carboxylate dehydrogenase